MKTPHTPTPWTISAHPTCYAVIDANGTTVAETRYRAEAEAIVLAVNEHEGLVRIARKFAAIVGESADGDEISLVFEDVQDAAEARSILARIEEASRG